MPFVIICDHCKAQLCSAIQLPIQSMLRCQECAEIFEINALNQHDPRCLYHCPVHKLIIVSTNAFNSGQAVTDASRSSSFSMRPASRVLTYPLVLWPAEKTSAN